MTLQELFRHFGSKAALARTLGVTKAAVGQWKKVPERHCPTIERATNGAIRCEDLRPDVDWAVLRKNCRDNTGCAA